jgi:hypothetical protein
MEPQSKLVEEEVKSIELEVGAKAQVVIQNENIEHVAKQQEAQDVI